MLWFLLFFFFFFCSNEFQFFPQRFIDLQEREALYYRKTVGYKAQKQEEQDKIDSAISLTDDEQAEKDKLTASGFPDWTRRDFYAFVKGCERFGRDNIVSIAAEIDGKTVEDVTKYSKVFWQRFKELPGKQDPKKEEKKNKKIVFILWAQTMKR